MAQTSTRLDARFAQLAEAGKKAFVAFVTAGDPDIATSAAIWLACPRPGPTLLKLAEGPHCTYDFPL